LTACQNLYKNYNQKHLISILSTLISSKTRVKLLLKFFLNANNKAYLRGLAKEFGESTNAVRLELNRLEEAGMLSSEHHGNKKFFQANTKHPLYNEVNSIVRKYIGLDQIIEEVIERLGEVQKVYLTGDWAQGKESKIIDLYIVGKDIDRHYLLELIEKAEGLVGKKIKYLIYDNDIKNAEGALLLWSDE
jgi:predicted nucleotidyltransferase